MIERQHDLAAGTWAVIDGGDMVMVCEGLTMLNANRPYSRLMANTLATVAITRRRTV